MHRGNTVIPIVPVTVGKMLTGVVGLLIIMNIMEWIRAG